MSTTKSKYDSSRYVNLILLLKNNSPIVCQCRRNFIGRKMTNLFNPKFEFIHIFKDIYICQIEKITYKYLDQIHKNSKYENLFKLGGDVDLTMCNIKV